MGLDETLTQLSRTQKTRRPDQATRPGADG